MKTKTMTIAEAIICIVAKSSDPITFLELYAQIPEMFAQPGECGFDYEIEGILVYSGLTIAGAEGLAAALRSHQVAMMPCRKIVYLARDVIMLDPNEIPICLAPSHMANYGCADRLMVIPPIMVPLYEQLIAQQTEPRVFRL